MGKAAAITSLTKNSRNTAVSWNGVHSADQSELKARVKIHDFPPKVKKEKPLVFSAYAQNKKTTNKNALWSIPWLSTKTTTQTCGYQGQQEIITAEIAHWCQWGGGESDGSSDSTARERLKYPTAISLNCLRVQNITTLKSLSLFWLAEPPPKIRGLYHKSELQS